MSDFEQMVQYWDNTGEWRKSYYTQIGRASCRERV